MPFYEIIKCNKYEKQRNWFKAQSVWMQFAHKYPEFSLQLKLKKRLFSGNLDGFSLISLIKPVSTICVISKLFLQLAISTGP